MTAPIILTIVLLLAFHFIEKRFFANRVYQVIAPDNSWVAEVNSRNEADIWKRKGYQVFKSTHKNGLIYFKQI